MDLRPTPEQDQVRAECRAWLREHLPWEYGTGLPPRFATLEEEVAFGREWQHRLAEARWVGVTWPADVGGRGAGPLVHYVVQEELARARAPELVGRIGINLVGPTLLAHGTDEQRARWLGPILRADILFCQLFSEPGAGSDLASLSTRAVRTEGGWRLSGQKVWTSYAQFADWGLCLARTDPDVKKQAGITSFAIDMRADGVEVRPLKQITGESDFNEVFLDEVFVPDDCVIGDVNDGWRVSSSTLTHERGTNPRQLVIHAQHLEELLRLAVARGGFDDHRTAQRLAEAYVEVRLFQLHNWRSLSRLEAGRPLGPEGSALKLYWSEMSQRLHRLALDVLGPAAPLAAGADGNPGDGEWQRSWLYYQAASIFAGTNEIQRTIIGERVLGLPREPAPGSGQAVSGPLEGLRVLDLGTRIAAPFCAGLLGEQGAEVIKIEQPGTGDFMREIGPFVDGYSLFWAVEGRGRKSVTLDLRQPAGRDLLQQVAARCDVVCENFRPGTLERWGLGPADLDPRLVMVRISAFGQDGPYAKRPGLDRLGIGYGGLLNLTGYPDRPPVRPGVTTSDYLTGVFAAQAATAALYRRDAGPRATGTGAVIDAALYGSVLRILEWTIAGYDRAGIVREREGNRLTTSAPLDNYPTADGKYVCLVAGSDTNYARLSAAMGRPELVDDPRFARLADRAERSDEINGIVAEWTASLPAAEVEARAIEHDVPVATAYTAADICHDPHMAARADLVAVDDPVLGAVRQQAPFPRFAGEDPPAAPTGAPGLGEHTREVLAELAGRSDAELDQLAADRVI